jgi:hypothetical protein
LANSSRAGPELILIASDCALVATGIIAIAVVRVLYKVCCPTTAHEAMPCGASQPVPAGPAVSTINPFPPRSAAKGIRIAGIQHSNAEAGKMSKHALYLVTYSRGIHPITGQVKPHHWAYFLETHSSSPEAGGVIFQLRGMPGGFHYPGPEQMDVTQDGGPGELRDKLEVGEVEVDGADVEGVTLVRASDNLSKHVLFCLFRPNN